MSTTTATITRPSVATGRPFTQQVIIVRDCTTYTGIEQGRAVWVSNVPDGPERLEVLSDAEQATIRTTTPAPAAFTIHADLDVTEAHGAPSAHVYGLCQAATSLARCMGSRVTYTEVEGRRWRMERQGGTDVWVAVDMTALAAFHV